MCEAETMDCEVIHEICRELGHTPRRDPIEYHEAFGKRAKVVQEAGDVEAALGCRLLAAVFSMYFKRGADGPFGPLVVWPDGSRSFLPKDLKAENAAECFEHVLGLCTRGGLKMPDPVDVPARLRLGGDRRGEEHRTRASKERAAVHHSIT